MAGAGDGSTVGVMGEEVDGSTAGRHLYRRPPLERVARISARLRKHFGNSNRFSNRQKAWPSTLENRMLICYVDRFRLSPFRKK